MLNDYMKNLHLKFMAEFPEIWLSSRNFYQGEAKPIVMQISFIMLMFLLFSDQISGGKSLRGEGANCLRGLPLWKKARKSSSLREHSPN